MRSFTGGFCVYSVRLHYEHKSSHTPIQNFRVSQRIILFVPHESCVSLTLLSTWRLVLELYDSAFVFSCISVPGIRRALLASSHDTHSHSSQLTEFDFEGSGNRCALCKINPEQLYREIAVLTSVADRRRLIAKHKSFYELSSKMLDKLLRNPKAGDFWQGDHTVAVAEGGGEASLDNLRILCTPCHLKVKPCSRKQPTIIDTPPLLLHDKF